MSEANPKGDLLRQAAAEYQAFRAAVEGLDEAHLTEPWLGSWGVREIVAHIVGWQRELAPALERMARGERPIMAGVSYEDVDGWNAKFAGGGQGRRAADLLRELEASHAAFLRAAEAVPERRYEPGKTAHRIVDLNSAHHYREHGAEIRAWRLARGL